MMCANEREGWDVGRRVVWGGIDYNILQQQLEKLDEEKTYIIYIQYQTHGGL